MEQLTFNLLNKKGHPVKIMVNGDTIQVTKKYDSKSIAFQDFIGVWTPLKFSNNVFNCELIYTKTKESSYNKHGIDKLKRKFFIELPLQARDAQTIKDFRNKLLEKFYELDNNNFKPKLIPDTDVVYYKRALVLVNPNAGNKKGLKIFAETARTLYANGIFADKLVSQPNRYIQNLIRDMPFEKISQYDMIIAISGDGIPHEVINGYMERKDIDFAKYPLTFGMLPAGSGCALTENCTKLSQHHNNFANCLYNICQFRRHPLCLERYDCLLNDGTVTTIWGFLNMLYGFFADVDIESEFLRTLGHLRFDVYGVWKYFFSKKYQIKVQTPVSDDIKLPPVNIEIDNANPDINTFEERVYSFYSSALPFMSKAYMSSPSIKDNHGYFDVQIFPTSVGKKTFLSYLLSHTEHKNPNNYGIVEKLVKQYRLTTSPNDENPNIDIDGETYKALKIRKVQASISDFMFYSLI
jgi:diacylglycerol kinase family enzyme